MLDLREINSMKLTALVFILVKRPSFDDPQGIWDAADFILEGSLVHTRVRRHIVDVIKCDHASLLPLFWTRSLCLD